MGVARMLVMVMVVVVVVVPSTFAFKLLSGSCPMIPSVETLDMERFKGLWYVMESFDGREECVTWNITSGKQNGTWYLQETKGSGILSMAGISGSSLTTATLTEDSDGTGSMSVNWPLNIASSYAFIVHDTDYDHYAGVVMCQSLLLAHRQNGIVLSRTPKIRVDQRQMSRANFDGLVVEYYKRVKQSICERYRPEISGGAGSSDAGPLGGSRDTAGPYDGMAHEHMVGDVYFGGQP